MAKALSFVSCLLLIIWSPVVLADSSKSEGLKADITGAWRFETDVYHDGSCRLWGNISITKSTGDNMFSCKFVAREKCESMPEWDYEAEQTCVALRRGDKLSIGSTVLKVNGDPNDYWPDNFELVIKSSKLMTGELRSATIAPIEFKREGPPIS